MVIDIQVLSIIKAEYNNPTANNILNSKIRNNTRMSTISTSMQHWTEGYSL